jgi:hypothetical protein
MWTARIRREPLVELLEWWKGARDGEVFCPQSEDLIHLKGRQLSFLFGGFSSTGGVTR